MIILGIENYGSWIENKILSSDEVILTNVRVILMELKKMERTWLY